MNLLDGMGPSDPKSAYDAPYFGQIFLAGVFRAIGYPQSLNPSVNVDVDQIKVLWIIPRLVMSSLAVIDTFLLFKICERRYNEQVGLIASVTFAVLPITLLLLRMWLESILLPFLLSAILLAIYSKNFINERDNNKKIFFIVMSGILLGLAIFTKVPAMTMIPLIGFVIFNNHKSLRILSVWFIPVILIPLIWPAFAYSLGEFDDWLNGIYRQTHRSGPPFISSIQQNLNIDPVILVVGSIGIFYALIKRDYFLILWALPFMAFSYLIGWTQFFHIIMILPALCIAPAKLITDLSSRFKNEKFSRLLPFVTISGIGIIGLIFTIEIITQDFTRPYFEAAAYINRYLDNVSENNYQDSTMNPRWSSFGIGQFITADLGSTQNICSVDIAWTYGNVRVYHFVIATSTDGTSFTNKFSSDSSGTTLNSEKYIIPATDARYVRVTVNGNTVNNWANIAELDVFGSGTPPPPGSCTTNLPISGVTASGNEVGNVPSNVLDNNLNNTGYRTTIISNPFYFWIPQYVFHLDHDYTGFFSVGTIRAKDVILVVDDSFRGAMKNENEGGEWLRKIIDSYNNSLVSKIKDISILRYNVLRLSPQVNSLNLIDLNFSWKSWNDVNVIQKQNDLMLYVNTTSSDSVYNHAYLSIDANSTFSEPLFLTLQYVSKTSKGKPTYLLEVRDDNEDKSLWHVNLDNTSGKLATDTFILPKHLANKQLEIRLYIITQGPSEHTLSVKNFFIF